MLRCLPIGVHMMTLRCVTFVQCQHGSGKNMGFLWVTGFSFFHCVASPFHCFVTAWHARVQQYVAAAFSTPL